VELAAPHEVSDPREVLRHKAQAIVARENRSLTEAILVPAERNPELAEFYARPLSR
jgi:hypothetical protein